METEPRLSEEEAKDLFRAIAQLPIPKDDIPLAVLKSHLCLEVMMRKFIHRQMPRPVELERARLTFYQNLCIARALDADVANTWVWDALSKLNETRNKIAHDLEVHNYGDKTIEDAQTAFIEFVETASPFDHKPNEHYNRFDVAVRSLYTILFKLVHGK